jgi:glutathione peroxidase
MEFRMRFARDAPSQVSPLLVSLPAALQSCSHGEKSLRERRGPAQICRPNRLPAITLDLRYYILDREVGNRSGASRLLSLLAEPAKAHEKPALANELPLSLSPDIAIKTIDGEAHTLGDFAGQALLIVNVASQCGFTPQYMGLEALHRRFRERGFAVLGFPCNQFGHQEPGDEAAIRKFCTDKYDVTFPMFAKVEVNGANAHPLFQTLKDKAPGILGTQVVKWNFTKFLIDRNHRVLRRYAPTDKPEKLAKDIEATLG